MTEKPTGWDHAEKRIDKGPWSALWYIMGFVLVIAMIGFGLRSFGLIGRTAVERAVFEQSYQKKAADADRLRRLQAQCAVVTEAGRAALNAQLIAAGDQNGCVGN